uniref:Bm1492, isoform b n=2 Tax=Brugia malayi TaxID=6279 RepID=A0A0H5SC83_BRUMA|nr:Bm1492, isoform b [Brugia malayi]
MWCDKMTQLSRSMFMFITCCYAIYNANELQNVAYDLEIAEIPFGLENLELDGGTLMEKMPKNTLLGIFNVDEASSAVVASEFGQKFICSLPKIPSTKTSNRSKSNLTMNLISDVIAASFYVQNCIRKNTGWWTYELCYNEYVQQFRLEGSKIVGKTISLGHYKNNSNINLSKHESEKLPYFEQIYDDGTVCDVTEKSRLTRVWYMCDEALSTSEAYIADVDEPSSCEYIIRVKTGSLCKLDLFLSQSKPRDPLSIICRPLLEQKAVEQYLEKVTKEKRQKEEAKKESGLLIARADSIQRQRYARKRLTKRTPKSIREMEETEKELKMLYEDIMRSITKLNVDLTKVKADLHFIYDDLHEMETRYITEADEDRGNIYWYFKDPYWDRKFFPVTFAHSRGRNNYYLIMSSFLKKIDEEYDEEKMSYSKFLSDIDEKLVTEAYLSVMIGSLRKAFHEGIFPDIVNDVDDVENPFLAAIWSNAEKQLEILQLFEYKVLKLLSRGVEFTAEDLMSHVARQLLSVRALLLSDRSDYNFDRKLNYIVVEKMFLKFMQSYNRAVLRYDKKSWGNFMKHTSAETFRMFENPNMFLARIEDLSPKNAHLFYTDNTAVKGWGTTEEASIDNRKGIQNVMSKEEKASQLRMLERARRKNLRKKVELYLRSKKTAKKSESDGTLFHDGFDDLRKQLFVFKSTLEEKIRETGLIQGAEVKVQLVSPVGNVISSTGVGGLDGERVNAVLKAFFLEQDSVSDEENRYDRLARGYTYGAGEEEGEKVRKNGDDDDDDLKSSILPILKRILP